MQILLLCSRAIILLLLTETFILLSVKNYCYYSAITIITKTVIQELYLNRIWRLDIRKSE